MTDAPRAQNPQAQGNPMHALAAGRIVGEVMKRLREGDCPTTPKFSNETLEDALLEVHRLFQREQEEHKRHESDLAATRAERDALAALVDEWIEIYRKIGDGMPILCDDVVRRCVSFRAKALRAPQTGGVNE